MNAITTWMVTYRSDHFDLLSTEAWSHRRNSNKQTA
jgi:hypothetical protein